MLYFFASWCPYCQKQTPAIVEAHKQLRKQGVIFLGVNVFDGEEEQVRAFAEAYGMTFPVILDAEDSIADLYRVDGVPHTVLISPRGTVSREISGWSPNTNFIRPGRSIAGGRNCKLTAEQLP